MNKNIEKLWELATECYINGEYKEESRIRKEICRLIPKDAKARHNYALSLMFCGNYSEAEKQFILALDLDPYDSRSYNNYGLLKYYVYGDIDSAVDNITKSLLRSNSMDEFIRHIHNFLMILSLMSSSDNSDKIIELKEIIKKIQFKNKKNIEYINNLVDAFLLINNAKIAFISRNIDKMKNFFLESTIIFKKINLKNYSKGALDTYQNLLFIHELLIMFNNMDILNDYIILHNMLESSIETMKGITYEYKNIEYSNGISKGTHSLYNIHKPLIFFCESIILAISYFKDGKNELEKIENNIIKIKKYSNINYYNIDQELMWSLILLKKTIIYCELIILINNYTNNNEIRRKYWTQYATIISKYNYNYDSLLLESENLVRLLDDGPFKKSDFKVIEQIYAKKITTNIKIINHLFEYHTDIKHIFLEDIEAVSKIHTPCLSSDDFVIKIGALNEFFQVPIKPLRLIVQDFDQSWKSLTLFERWLIQNNYQYNPNLFTFFKKIVQLRNSLFPFHPSNKKYVKIMKDLGFSFPLEYSTIWRDLLKEFNSCLGQIQDCLSRIN